MQFSKLTSVKNQWFAVPLVGPCDTAKNNDVVTGINRAFQRAVKTCQRAVDHGQAAGALLHLDIADRGHVAQDRVTHRLLVSGKHMNGIARGLREIAETA